MAVVSPVGPVSAQELPLPCVTLCACRHHECVFADDAQLFGHDVRWLRGAELLPFLRAVAGDVISAMLDDAASAQRAVDEAIPDIAHRAACRRARWCNQPPPRREDADLFDTVRVPREADDALFDTVRLRDPDDALFDTVGPRDPDDALLDDASSCSSAGSVPDVALLDDVRIAEPSLADAAPCPGEEELFVAESDDGAGSGDLDGLADEVTGDLHTFDELPPSRICPACNGLAARCLCAAAAAAGPAPSADDDDDDGELWP